LNVSISVVSQQDDGDLADVSAWLEREDEFRGRLKYQQAEARDGELGSLTDALSLALGSGGALTVLAASLKTYFAQLRRPTIRISIEDKHGRRVDIDAENVKHIEEILAATFTFMR